MALPEILIGSKLDAKGFKEAETALGKLTKSTRNLAAALGIAFGARALINYSKQAVKAFTADDNAARSLGKTLENLGLSTRYAGAELNGYISRLEQQTGVLDDELRPAMDRLLRATGNLTKSQELLGLALDISAGTGKSLTQVSQGLQKAYLGNNASLGRLGVGLTKAELTTSSFLDIQEKLTSLFSGQAVSAANSYQGSLNKLTIAANNAKEVIGKGLIDALAILSDSSTVDPTVTAIDKIAKKIADLTKGVARFIRIWKEMATGFDLFIPEGGYGNTKRFSQGMSIAGQTENSAGRRLRLKIEKDATTIQKTANELLKISNKDTKEKLALTAGEKALAELKAMFDLDAIEIQAALNGTISEEDRLRLNALKAINAGDTAMALLAINAMNAATSSKNLAVEFDRLLTASSTFYTANAIASQAANAEHFNSLFPSTSSDVFSGQVSSNDMLKPSVSGDAYGGYSGQASSNGFYFPSSSPQPSSIVVNVSGSVTTERDLVSAITQGIYNNQASGVPINYTTQY
jgi:hypothetical protein